MDKKQKNSSIHTITDQSLEPYYIQLDDYSYIAQKSTYSEAGHEYQSTIGHYISLNGCIQAIARDSAKSESYNSLREFIERFETKAEQLKKLIKA